SEELLGSDCLRRAGAPQHPLGGNRAPLPAVGGELAWLPGWGDELARRERELAAEARATGALPPSALDPARVGPDPAQLARDQREADRARLQAELRQAVQQLGFPGPPTPEQIEARRREAVAERERLGQYLQLEQRWFELNGMTPEAGDAEAGRDIAQTIA